MVLYDVALRLISRQLVFSPSIQYGKRMEKWEAQAVKLDIEFNPFAFNCGVTEADIRFEEEKNLLIGFDVRLNPIEILYNEINDHTFRSKPPPRITTPRKSSVK
ncbi:MAG: hypothetical protein LBK63_13950 [Treponema sp.]|jgi:hypothetical protein|nr:hypothetical protein [Treponema sp.]